MKQKKKIKKKPKTPQPVHYQAPADRQAAGKPKTKPVLIIGIIAGIAAGLILLGLLWNFAWKKEDRAQPRSSELKTDTRNEPEGTISASGSDSGFTESQYGIEMAHVRGGTLLMGCMSEHKDDCYDYEEPEHTETLGDFYIGKYEVTQAQWKAVMGNNPSGFKGDDLPVENVSWNDAQEFIKKLNAATGKAYRLPTAAEWEYAARGGGQSRKYNYSGGNSVEDVAWYEGNSGSKTHPVGTKSANELGIHDMSGNVWEWMSDIYGNIDGAPNANSADRDKDMPRIIRGGGWGSYARGVRVSNYFNNGPGNRYNILGFRLACDFIP